MPNEEVAVVVYRTLALIAEKEKLKAIEESDYGSAFFVGVLEGIFREAEISTREKR